MRTENCRPLLRSGAPVFFGGKSPTRSAESDGAESDETLHAVFPQQTPLSSAAIGLQRNAAFTLIELMVVIAIILVLVSLVIGAAKYAATKAGTSRVRAEIAAMETALESYKNDNGVYPQGDNSLRSGTNIYNALAAGSKTYMSFRANQIAQLAAPVSTNIMDSFGRPYYYQYPGVSNSASFDLWSAGPDAQTNTPDDIVNWRQ